MCGKKELEHNTKPFTGRTLRGLLIQLQNISFRSSGMRRKQNCEISGTKSDTAVLTFSCRFLSSPLLSLSLLCFFSVHLVGFSLMGKAFGKPFGTLELDERKGR